MEEPRPDLVSRALGPARGRLAAALGVATVLLTLVAVSGAGVGGFGGLTALVAWPVAVWFPVRLLVAPPPQGRADVVGRVALPWRGAVQDAVDTGRRPTVPEVRAVAADLARWSVRQESQVRWRAAALTGVLVLAGLALLRADPAWLPLLPTAVFQLVAVSVAEIRLRRTASRFSEVGTPARS